MSTEWFRSPDWTDSEQAQFEARLERARPRSRAQYFRIKAIALHGAGLIQASRMLLFRVVEGYPDTSDYAGALELLGDIALSSDDPWEAERYYRRLIDERPTLNGTSGMAEVSLAEIRTKRGDSDGVTVVAGGKRDLTAAQQQLLSDDEVAALEPGAHAEVTALNYAEENGLTPQAMGVSRPICPDCQSVIEASGGEITSPTTAVWGGG
ncbi:MAG: hypothetical protein ABSE52_07310 [Candidatus Dormibacteria bacterium]|jgi:hypothetical protein